MEGYLHRLKAFLLPFSLCGGLFLRFSPYVFFSLIECPFLRFFGGGLFHRLKAFLLLFSLCGGLFVTFFLVGGLFPPFEGLSATFYLHVGVLFWFLWGPFFACPPPPPYQCFDGGSCLRVP